MRKLLVLMIMVAVAVPLLLAAEVDREEAWKKYDDAVKKGLPKTAIAVLEPIITDAIKEKAYGEAIRAIGLKISLEGNIQGNKPEEKIVRMEQAIEDAPRQMKPVLSAVLANWYWHYFQQNRYRLVRRTATATAPGSDFTTWDLPRLISEIDKQFSSTLDMSESLKTVKVSDYDRLLEKGTMPDSFRPTMYDFLVYNALQFYSMGEQAGSRSQDAFDLLADSPVFGSADEFINWELKTTDTESPTVKAIGLYQDLLRFHAEDDDRSAWLDANLSRLVFGFNKALGETKNDRFKEALKSLIEKNGDHRISARALYQWARVLHQQGDYVEAHKIASRGVAAFAGTPGGNQCFNLVQKIESRSATMISERVWNAPLPDIDVRYRNVEKVYFRLVSHDWHQLIRSAYRVENLNANQRKALLARESLHSWSMDLPKTVDYHERHQAVSVPEEIKPGFYFLISSHDPKFSDSNNVVQFTGIWKSDLALVMRTERGSGTLGGFVLNAISGEPLAGAKVQSWIRANNNTRTAGPLLTTDENGAFKTRGTRGQRYLFHVTHGDHQLGTYNGQYVNIYNTSNQPSQQTIFFTDRSLYRPGQTVKYKGIAIHVNQQEDDYHVLADTAVVVVFQDRNGREIARRSHRSNDYGSFNGSFTAPRDSVSGRMILRVDGPAGGAISINVEEYKRPKFEVEIEPPEEAGKLNEEVIVTGKAMSFTGAAIGGAGLRYRVVREVRYPPWIYYRYYGWQPPGASQEIAQGRAITEANGTFKISFVARPDLSVAEQDEPRFHYTIHADVTDTTGETRSGDRAITVGYTALQASLSADSWLTDEQAVEIAIHTSTLDGVAQAAEGTIRIHRLEQPEKVQRARLAGLYYPTARRRGGKVIAPPADKSSIHGWPLGDEVVEAGFQTDAEGRMTFEHKLARGVYRVILETADRFGKKVSAETTIQVLDPDAEQFQDRVANHVASPSWTVEPGDEFQLLWGSGYEECRAFVEIEHRGRILQSFWTDGKKTQLNLRRQVTEAMRGGFTVRVSMVRENRAYLTSHHVNVPWSNKNLEVKWERFVSKLKPGQKETWTAVISGPDAKTAVAELVAGLYDASLDEFLPHAWRSAFGVFRTDYSMLDLRFTNFAKGMQRLVGNWPGSSRPVRIQYRRFPQQLIGNFVGYQFGNTKGRMMRSPAQSAGAAPPGQPSPAANGNRAMAEGQEASFAQDKSAAKRKDSSAGGPNLNNVAARKNLDETAFFFPHLVSAEDGTVRMEFTVPEALTRWKFMGFAHDSQLRAGFLQDSVVTAKELMIEPNPPRFLREGDQLEFTVKVTNQSATRQDGTVRLTLADARTLEAVDDLLGNLQTDLEFDVPAGESKSFSWRLEVPDDIGFLVYKTVGSSGRLSDGEEGYLPVLSRRILVTESLPLPIRGPETKSFDFERLRKSAGSRSLRHKSLTVQMVSNPSWYAVMALPYLMEFPHECSEQTFNRLYANALARHIANSDMRIRRTFDLWKNTPALDSPLEQNEDLKAVALEETPWLKQAQSESQARRNVGILFDENRLNQETARLLRRLADMQLGNGAWPWFPGGPANDYITLYITTGFGRMRHLGVEIDVTSAVRSLQRLDGWIDRIYRDILAHGKKENNHLSAMIALYLYGRSFFLEDMAIQPKNREAVDYFLGQARTHWLKLANRQSQAHLAVALKRFGDAETASGIMRSIKERSVSDEELGMFWRDLEKSWWWYRAPIETQAMMIEAFDEVMNDAQAVEDCKVWLLKQKQTQDWKTSKATADAVYGLLLRGDNLLASEALVEVSLGGNVIEPENVEAGTGFYEKRFSGEAINPKMGRIEVKKVDAGVAWGSVHWQYLEDMANVTAYDGTPLKLTKSLYTRVFTPKGKVLKPVDGPLEVGDELIVRIVLRVDRDMEYVHLKDYRGSGTEPTNVLSKYRYQDGLAYYESTRDTASHFYIDYLPKGTYVFEYASFVVHRGSYQTGLAQIQCMYAPEFNSHSESLPIEVK